MRRIFSERNVVVLLFVMALVVFVFAQEQAKKVEKKYMYPGSAVSSVLPPPAKTAAVETKPVQVNAEITPTAP